MNERTLRVLEFSKVKQRLAGYTSSALGRELVEQLLPMTDDWQVERALQETSEAREICRTEEFPLQGLLDIRSGLQRAAVGALLHPEELLNIAQLCACARRADRFFRHRSEKYPLLSAAALRLAPLPDLETEIGSTINEYAEVKDSASPRLRKLRSDIRSLQNRAKERIDNMVRSATIQKFLQEPIVTVRNERHVLPVKVEYRSQVPGIVHDQSASGATLFIEPMSIVEMNNDLRRLQVEEEREVERILRQLAALVQAETDLLQENLQALAHLDFCMAKGKLSYDLRAVCPMINRQAQINLRQARHPLLPPETVVPNSIYLGQDFTVLLITGPNTGGKTVTLKTVGLLLLMAQAGLHIPADEGSEVAVFANIFADIGDEQSIEQSLSTFSSHMTNIVEIASTAGERSLVLLDELGAGTDPAEGAALAMAIIDYLHARGSRVVATTHYSELKSYAYQKPSVQNASVEFDVETLQPTYRLTIGLPGKSNAFEISRRLGLAEGLIARAREYLSGEQIQVEDLIRQLDSSRRAAEEERELARQMRLQAEAARQQAERKLSELERKQESILTKAKQEARALINRQKQEVDSLLSDLRNAALQSRSTAAKETLQSVEEGRQRWRQLQQETETEGTRTRASQRPALADDREFRAGDQVLVKHLGQRGQLLSAPGADGEAQVQLGALRLNCRVEQLEKLVSEAPEPPKPGYQMVNLSRQGVALELDLRGQTVDEAILRIDKYLDDALVAGLSRVSLIHGKGTGTLRNAVRDYLRSHRAVKSYRLGGPGEGGTGVTVVELNK
ncbi:MAG: endonuclease MutS2 [Bacillota bacterium]